MIRTIVAFGCLGMIAAQPANTEPLPASPTQARSHEQHQAAQSINIDIDKLKNQLRALEKQGKHIELAAILDQLGIAHYNIKSIEEAERYLDRSLKIRKSIPDKGDHEIAQTEGFLGKVYAAQGNIKKAGEFLARARDYFAKADRNQNDPNHANWTLELAGFYKFHERHDEAAEEYELCLKLLRNGAHAKEPFVGSIARELAHTYFDLGQFARAEAPLRITIEIARKTDGIALAAAQNDLAAVFARLGRSTDAEALYRKSLTIYETDHTSSRLALATALSNYGGFLSSLGRNIEAEEQLKHSVGLHRLVPDNDYYFVRALNHLGLTQAALGKWREAERNYSDALKIAEDNEDDFMTAIVLANTGVLNLTMDEPRRAKADLERAMEKFVTVSNPDYGVMVNAQTALGDANFSLGLTQEAEARYAESVQTVERHLGPDHPSMRVILQKLADLYLATERNADAGATTAKIEKLPQVGTRHITINFATTREREKRSDLFVNFGGEPGPLTAGQAVVVAANAAVENQAARRVRGAGLLYEATGDLTPETELSIRPISLQKGARIGPLAAQAGSRANVFTSQALVFVHGFNVEFHESVYIAAKIAFDLEFDGAMILFSWPSAGRLTKYRTDQKNAERSQDDLVTLLDELAKTMPGTTLHFLAHSMGNSVMLGALEKIAMRASSPTRLKVGEIIAAHADVELDRFKELATAIAPLGGKITAYNSDNDRALWLSMRSGDTPRAGASSGAIAGVDVIDISKLGDLIGLNHSGYANNPIVFRDISRLIATRARPVHARSKEFHLVDGKGQLWRFQPKTAIPRPSRR